jgi:hypothetical protein
MKTQVWQHSDREVIVAAEGATYRVIVTRRWFRSPTLRIERVGGGS